MSHPLVFHVKDGQHEVYIGRPSKWGNPFRIGVNGSRQEVIDRYKHWLTNNKELLSQIHELKDKRLGCHCAPLPCHGDVLATVANSNEDPVTTLQRLEPRRL